MEARAELKYARISPTKVQIVLDLIRNKEKLLKSAVANATNNFNMDEDKLYVSECFATSGPILKRMRPRAQGRAYRIDKKTAHVTLVVKEQED